MKIDVSAVIPTRGDVPLDQVMESLPFDDIVVWNNAERSEDLKVYGRYAAIEEAKHDVIYTQDDDCVLEPGAIEHLVAMYGDGEIVCNMPLSRWQDYPDSCLVGWGSIFPRQLVADAFTRFFLTCPTMAPYDDRFLKTCDVVFTTLTPHRKLDLGFSHLPWAETKGRMFKQPDHSPIRSQMLDMARAVRDAA